ncbi:MAG: hypothetical protein BGO01_03720 [Armatimonadetes bacterium 55-13]|nr:hypothetical protein [Armatimonadota bacterium]OJU63055.1 MAG: hypothetical protein BGO01_03720 [Armatimonadetes bacterium 55-13]
MTHVQVFSYRGRWYRTEGDSHWTCADIKDAFKGLGGDWQTIDTMTTLLTVGPLHDGYEVEAYRHEGSPEWVVSLRRAGVTYTERGDQLDVCLARAVSGANLARLPEFNVSEGDAAVLRAIQKRAR